MNGNLAQTLQGGKTQKIPTLTTATNAQTVEIYAADVNARYAVYHVVYTASAAGTAVFKSGTTNISATYTLAGAGTIESGNQDANQPLFVTNLNEALNITTTGTAAHTAALVVAKLPR